MIWRRLLVALGVRHTTSPTHSSDQPLESSISVRAPGLTPSEERLANEIINRELWADHFIHHATTIWHYPNLEPSIYALMRDVYLSSHAAIVAGTFSEADVWAPIEVNVIAPLVNTATHRVYERTFYRLESAVNDQFYSSARHAFFACIRHSNTEDSFEYWLVVNPKSPHICIQRASHNPLTFERAFTQNAKHRNCDCTWMATPK